jgi:hypothetical protein
MVTGPGAETAGGTFPVAGTPGDVGAGVAPFVLEEVEELDEDGALEFWLVEGSVLAVAEEFAPPPVASPEVGATLPPPVAGEPPVS